MVGPAPRRRFVACWSDEEFETTPGSRLAGADVPVRGPCYSRHDSRISSTCPATRSRANERSEPAVSISSYAVCL